FFFFFLVIFLMPNLATDCKYSKKKFVNQEDGSEIEIINFTVGIIYATIGQKSVASSDPETNAYFYLTKLQFEVENPKFSIDTSCLELFKLQYPYLFISYI